MVYALGSVARAARPHPHSHPRTVGQQLRHAGLAGRAERAEILDANHSFLPLRCSTSRCSVCSFTWPKMAWSTSITGASAHCPKQATVRREYLPSGVVTQEG